MRFRILSVRAPISGTAVCTVAMLLLLAIVSTVAFAADVSLHASNRYYKDASGNPMFLIGYYGWAAVPDGYFIDHPSRYADMITQGQPYKINYIRISLGMNRYTGWDGRENPAPFLYVGGKADLNQWDPVFWDGLRAQCALAQQNGVYVHLAIFDGVHIRGGSEPYRYINSFWKPSNQTASFYSNPDLNGNGNIDESNEFYQLSAFNGNTGIGYYQRRMIDKVIAETGGYDNVFYEIGNELLSSPSDWNTAVINYIKARTGKAITQNAGSKATNLDGWAQHEANTPAEVKSKVAAIVGMGYAAWEDPDGPALIDGSADDLRRSAWSSFAGGAGCWGGFTTDFWSGGSGFNATKGTYYKNLIDFIQNTGVKFWEMTPQHNLVTNGSTVNSCLAKTGSEYVAYVLNAASVNLDLTAVSGTAYYRLYDPKTGVFTGIQTVAGGGVRGFSKPGGADDWVIHVYTQAGTYCLQDAFAYSNGALNGNGGWTGSAGASQIEVINEMVRLWGGAGAYDAIKTTYCADPGTGYITATAKVYAGTGGRTIWNLWIDDTANRNLARWYGTANTARGRIGNTGNVTSEYYLAAGWNTLKVRIHVASNTSQFFFNGNDIGTLSHASEGAGDIVGRIRLERMDNWEAVGHYLYFDDFSIGEEGPDTTPPGPVTNFVATAGSGQNVLTWTNPGDGDFAGTMIRFSTAGFPGSPSGGAECYNGTGTSYTHSSLTNGVTYYYTAFAYDAVPNYSSGASASATPVAAPTYCFRDEFNYANGALNGNGGWSGNATASHIEITGGYVRIFGGPGTYYAVKTVNCGVDGSGNIWVRCNINGETGGSTMWSLRINDSSGNNFARWYGSGTNARGRIGDTGLVTGVQNLSGGWEEIAVKINPAADTSEFFFNGNSVGTLSHSSQGAGSAVGQLRFERIDNSNATSEHLYFDDLRVGG